MKSKKMGFWVQFREALRYLRESKNYIIAVSLVLLAGALFGVVFSSRLGFLDDFLKEIAGKIEGLSTTGIILFIFKNNMASSFLGILFGVVLGIFPILTALFNGIIIGYVMKLTWLESGFSDLWRIFPHGVLELPAVVISLSLGIRFGMFIFSKNREKEFVESARNSIILFVCFVIPLLIAAAIIEGLLIAAYK